MNDEIKEILEALRDSIDDTGTNKINFINWVNKIEDYITNLQQENEDYKTRFKKSNQITQLTNNWNELEEWLEEYYMSNERWHNEQLSDNDKKYYQKDYDIIAYMLKRFLGKMKEIKGKQ